MVERGEVWLVRLDPTVGGEIQKTRPCVVVSPNDMNAHLRTLVVAPMTTGGRTASFRVQVTFNGKQGLILPDQIRMIDQIRLIKQAGRLDESTLLAVLKVLGEMFAM